VGEDLVEPSHQSIGNLSLADLSLAEPELDHEEAALTCDGDGSKSRKASLFVERNLLNVESIQ